jgi:hypothetical protein
MGQRPGRQEGESRFKENSHGAVEEWGAIQWGQDEPAEKVGWEVDLSRKQTDQQNFLKFISPIGVQCPFSVPLGVGG